jgi:tryptophan halogenase
MSIKTITVVGGGSAGWMTAATLVKNFPNIKINVIESPNVPTVGVGESTLGQINEWLATLDIKDEDWMKECDASYKLSIKFTDFYKKGAGAFHYPFGSPSWPQDAAPEGLQDWYYKKILHPETPVTDFVDTFWPIMALVNENKITDQSIAELDTYRFDWDAAYHFDATKFGIWLKEKYCKPRGVNLITADVKEIHTNDSNITHLELDTGETVTSDLFIDCTGFRSILMEAIGAEFESWSDILPNDSAWATRLPFTDKEKELEPYTNCTAIGNGWVWNIPLWSRTGTGYVFSSKYISDEDALEEFKSYLRNEREVKVSQELVDSLEFKKIKMRVGIHKEIFKGNVCAIGLSAGFIEPLESNGLYSVHEFLHHLVLTLARQDVNQFDRDAFNDKCYGQFKAFAEFVALHYALSLRDDTPYWQDVRQRKMPKTMPAGLYSTSGIDNLMFRRMEANRYEFEMGGIICIATGMEYFPIDTALMTRYKHKYRYYDMDNVLNQNFKVWGEVKNARTEAVKNCPTLYNFLKERYKDD